MEAKDVGCLSAPTFHRYHLNQGEIRLQPKGQINIVGKMSKPLADIPRCVYLIHTLDGASLEIVGNSIEATLGISSELLLAHPKSRFSLVHPEDRHHVESSFSQICSTKRPYRVSYRLRRSNGAYILVQEESEIATGIDGVEKIITRISPCGSDDSDYTNQEARLQTVIQESESKYRALFENLIDAFAYYEVVLDQSGNPCDCIFLEVNSAFEKTTGLRREELIGRRVSIVKPGVIISLEEWLSTFSRVAFGAGSLKLEQLLKNLNRWFAISAYSPKPGYFVTIYEDISERKQAELQLLENQRAFEALLSNLPGMAYRCLNDPDWTMQYISEGCLELTGYSQNELLKDGCNQYNNLIHPDDRNLVWETVQTAVRKNSPYHLTYRLITKSGTVKWVWEHGNAVLDSNGRLIALEGFISDTTDRNRAEEALKSREEHFRSLIDNSSDVITLVDVAGRIVYSSPSVERVLGYSARELVDTSAYTYLHRRDRVTVRDVMRRALAKGLADISIEVRVKHKDGTWRILDAVGRNLLDNPHVSAIVINSRDITERRNIETERAQLATAVEQATESIVITDLDANIIYVNSAFEKISGYGSAEVLGKHVRLLRSGEHPAEYYREIWATLNAGEPWVGRFKNRRKNGTLYEEECAISPIKDAKGKLINFVAVKRDVTKEVELEDRLRQAQKLEAVGRLASGIAHDFNNLLAGIRGFAELITQEAGEARKLHDYADEIVRASTRAADLTSQLLAFARKGNYLAVPVDIHATIEDATNLLKHSIDRRIEIRTEMLAKRSVVRGDPSQIQSAILNLGVNARDAMPHGGRLAITTRDVFLDTDYCRRHSLNQGAGYYIAITVTDNGVGMDDEIISHIFDPFFTTKQQGQGTGLGLAGVYGCVRNHHGCVEVLSTLGKGSTFTLYLPVLDNSSIVEPNEQPDSAVDGRERILVVDDEEIVRKLAEKMLIKAGYKVTTCQDGEEALQLYRTAMSAIDLVLLDMMMPKMNGRDTFEALKRFNPDVKVIMMSGFSDQDVQEILKQGICGFIHKPFQMRVFLAKIREALDSTIHSNRASSPKTP